MTLTEENSWKFVESRFPFLTPSKGLSFNSKNFEEKCEEVATQLVRVQDKEAEVIETVVEPKQTSFQKMDASGLDKSEVDKCLETLSGSYQDQTIIPEAFNVKGVETINDDFVNIGLNYRLPRDWFLSYDETKTEYYNEFLFGDFGRGIVLGEREFLVNCVMKTPNVKTIDLDLIKPELLKDGLKKAISALNALEHKPKVVFPTIPLFLAMHGQGLVKYTNNMPKNTLRANLVIDGLELKMIEPLGAIPENTILFGDNAIQWLVKIYEGKGALYTDLGNDKLYPKKYVNVIAATTVKCEVAPEGICVINEENAEKI